MSVDVMQEFAQKKENELRNNENYKTFDTWCKSKSKNIEEMDVSKLYQAIQQWIQDVTRKPEPPKKTQKPRAKREEKGQEHRQKEQEKKEQKPPHPFGHICEPEDENSALCCLKDLRNYLFHRRSPEISRQECDKEVVTRSKKSYKMLLGEDQEAIAAYTKRLEGYTIGKCILILK